MVVVLVRKEEEKMTKTKSSPTDGHRDIRDRNSWSGRRIGRIDDDDIITGDGGATNQTDRKQEEELASNPVSKLSI